MTIANRLGTLRKKICSRMKDSIFYLRSIYLCGHKTNIYLCVFLKVFLYNNKKLLLLPTCGRESWQDYQVSHNMSEPEDITSQLFFFFLQLFRFPDNLYLTRKWSVTNMIYLNQDYKRANLCFPILYTNFTYKQVF